MTRAPKGSPRRRSRSRNTTCGDVAARARKDAAELLGWHHACELAAGDTSDPAIKCGVFSEAAKALLAVAEKAEAAAGRNLGGEKPNASVVPKSNEPPPPDAGKSARPSRDHSPEPG